MPILMKLTGALTAFALSTTMLTPVAMAKPRDEDARRFKTERPRSEMVRRDDPRFSARNDRNARPDTRGARADSRARGERRPDRGGGDRVRGDRGGGDRGGDRVRGDRGGSSYTGVRGRDGRGYTGVRNDGRGYTGVRPGGGSELRGGPGRVRGDRDGQRDVVRADRDQRRSFGDRDQRRSYGDRDQRRDYRNRDQRRDYGDRSRHRDYTRGDRNVRYGSYRDRDRYSHRRHHSRDWYRRDYRHDRHKRYRSHVYHHPRGWRYYRYSRPINIFNASIYYGPYYRTSYVPRYYIGGHYHYHGQTVILYDYDLYGLYDPPYGYHWVYDYGSGDAVLASIATGAIIGLVIGALAY